MNIIISKFKNSIKLKFPKIAILIRIVSDSFSRKMIDYLFFTNQKFKYREIKDILLKKKTKSVVVLGSGKSVNEISNFNYFDSALTIGLGRWIFHDYVPDVYFLETSDSGKLFDWTVEFIKIVNSKENKYSGVLILFDGAGPKSRKYILKNIAPSLKGNVRFAKTLKTLSGSGFFLPFVNILNFIKLPFIFNFIVHCRSSTAAMVMLGYYIGANSVILVGVDGYVGYFSSDPLFHKDYGGLEKNYKNLLHSTSNPAYGHPTLTECFDVIHKNIINVSVITKNSILCDVVQFINVNEIYFKEGGKALDKL